uniref:DUF47 family protein n=1 Tax=Thermofilum pendens TaxID=2269 RepID=A0A7C1TB50_THEPE
MAASTLLERLEQVIPGFHGYRQRALLREDDALIREKVASMLDSAKGRVERMIVIMRKKNIGAALRLDDLRLELIKASQMLKHAKRDTDLFEKGEANESVLEELLKCDYELVHLALRVMERVVNLSMSLEDREFMDKLNETINIVYELESCIKRREIIITGSK